MKAHVLHGIGDLRFEEVPIPRIREDEVLLKVACCGICGSDIPRIYTTGAHKHPLIPGHEFAGIVEETGAEVSPAWKGKTAAVFPLIACGKCVSCRRGLYEMCADYDYLGSRSDGAFAQYVAVPERCLMEVPDSVTAEEAAMSEPMAVAVHAMRAAMKHLPGTSKKDAFADKDVVVCGAGTIGLLLVMFLKEAGCERLLVIGNKDFQKEQAVRFGVPEEMFCDTRVRDAQDFIAAHTGGKGADVSFECVGSAAVIGICVRAAAPGGIVVTVGNPHGDIALDRDTYWRILRRQLTLKGVWNSSFTGQKDDDWHYVLDRLKSGRIKPSALITHRFAPDLLGEGLAIMRDKTAPYIKIMINYE